ncbi:MAG: polysaccharide biosynthesis/export family protein, partial [Blastocatellia bacterium]|nr:polysaccharide biosynthesis/export family protein [Blastocatellia bacterium]
MHKAIIYIATVCIVAVSTLSLAAQTTGNSIVATVSNATDERYRIGFQDTLEIQVFRRPELTIRQVVSPAGTIRL